jgi:hypothetical protein
MFKFPRVLELVQRAVAAAICVEKGIDAIRSYTEMLTRADAPPKE